MSSLLNGAPMGQDWGKSSPPGAIFLPTFAPQSIYFLSVARDRI